MTFNFCKYGSANKKGHCTTLSNLFQFHMDHVLLDELQAQNAIRMTIKFSTREANALLDRTVSGIVSF